MSRAGHAMTLHPSSCCLCEGTGIPPVLRLRDVHSEMLPLPSATAIPDNCKLSERTKGRGKRVWSSFEPAVVARTT